MQLSHLYLYIVFCLSGTCISTRSVWNYQANVPYGQLFPNYLYENSAITLQVKCTPLVKEGDKIRVHWFLYQIDCMNQMFHTDVEAARAATDVMERVAKNGGNSSRDMTEFSGEYKKKLQFQFYFGEEYTCDRTALVDLPDLSEEDYVIAYLPDEMYPKNGSASRTVNHAQYQMVPKSIDTSSKKFSNQVTRAWADGMYHFLVLVTTESSRNDTASITVSVEQRGDYGYLSANLWPLLPYSGLMSFFYLVMTTIWVINWARSHEHSTRFHIVIGVVAIAGSIVNTFQFTDLQAYNASGRPIDGFKWLCGFVDAVQGSLTDMLLMVLTTGYGITRPFLSKTLIYSSATIAVMSFLASCGLQVVDDEELKIKYDYPLAFMIMMIVYGLVLLVVGAWIMFASVSTFIHLCKRKHANKKIVVFSIFMTVSIIAFLGKITVVLISYFELSLCKKDWKSDWLFTHFDKMENVILLAALMWLWRPVDQAQSYAFEPLATVDEGNEFEDDEFGSDEDDEVDKIPLETLKTFGKKGKKPLAPLEA